MAPRKKWETEHLFPPPQPTQPGEQRPKVPSRPIWTENKARLIAGYLYRFVLVTRHGAYVDGFAGPQYPERPDSWAARLVLDMEPRWLNNFYLFDKDPEKCAVLEGLRKEHAPRNVRVRCEDFSIGVGELLDSGVIRPAEATFCLLDQRTVECHWETVSRIAQYPKKDFKIEQFYFLANAWLARSLKSRVSPDSQRALRAWWGREDWRQLVHMKSFERAQLVAGRFKAGTQLPVGDSVADLPRSSGSADHVLHGSRDGPPPGPASDARRV